MEERYSRHWLLPEIGKEGQERLGTSRVLVVGAGGLGCPVLQYLAAAGVGHLGILDPDTVSLSNLQRQVLYGMGTLGQPKALAAKARLTDLNPDIFIEAHHQALTAANALAYFSAYDIVVDGSDNLATRYLASDASLLTQTPLVYGAIHKFEGQVAVLNHNGGPSYRCLFPEAPKAEEVPACGTLGVLGVLPGIVGAQQANETLKLLLGIGQPLSGKLWVFNALSQQSAVWEVAPRPDALAMVKTAGPAGFQALHAPSCSAIPETDWATALNWPDAQWLDVREPHERPLPPPHLKALNCPNASIDNAMHQLSKKRRIAVYCHSGQRSKLAVSHLRKQGYNAYSIRGGITAQPSSLLNAN